MRLLIIGGTGFIGPFVIRDLVEQGHDVTAGWKAGTSPRYHASQHRAGLAGEPRANTPSEIDPKQFDYAAEDAALEQVRRATAS
jgi:nucleoside-diphosphate-sugar epimerase